MSIRGTLGVIAASALVALASAADAAAAELPAGFSDTVVFEGLTQPTSVAFSPDGRVFVTEKRGLLLGFGGRTDPEPAVVADLRTEVHSFDERGLMSVVLDPRFPRRPFAYVAYTYNAPIGGRAPTWGVRPAGKRKRGGPEGCLPGKPDPAFEMGCLASSRVSRLTIGRRNRAKSEQVLIEDWCQQFSSHSIGDLAFDRHGALLVGGGDGAYFDATDIGSRGNPVNACGDPAGEGGALRAQDLLTPGDPATLDGTIARIDPLTGAPAFGNPSAAPGNEGRIVAYGLRNPFRFAVRPGTDELWIGDVGWVTAEEIDVAPLDRISDFGWPCYEGRAPQARYAARAIPLCNALYASTAVRRPWLAYRHGDHVVAGERCPASDGAAISGVAFDRARSFPAPFDDALLLADYVRGCIWAAPPGRFGKPRAGSVRVLESGAAFPIDLEPGPGGTYYVDLGGGTIHRIAYERPTVEVRLRTRPPGLRVGFDDRVERGGRAAITVSRGSTHRLLAPARQRRNGKTFRFRRWSGGGGRSQPIAPTADATPTATYECVEGCGKAA